MDTSRKSHSTAIVEERAADLARLRRRLPSKGNIYSISSTPSNTQFNLHGGCIRGEVHLGTPEVMSKSAARVADLAKRHDQIAAEIRANGRESSPRDLALDNLVTALRKEEDLLPNGHVPRDPLLDEPKASYDFLTRNEGCLWSRHPRIISLEIEQWKWEEHFNSTEDVINRCGPVDPKV